MSGKKAPGVVLSLPSKLYVPIEKDATRWFLLQLLDPKMDWRVALKDARIQVEGANAALQTPNVAEGLGLLVDKEAGPAQMLMLKPSPDGTNLVLPAGRIEVCIKIGSLLPKNGDLGSDSKAGMKLYPLDKGETSNDVPVAFWRLGPAIPEEEMMKTLSFRCFSRSITDRKGELIGAFEAAPKMQLVGRTLNLDGANGAKYLAGCLPEGSKKLLLYEAEVYWVERNSEFGRDKAEELRQEIEERKVLDFKQQRSDAIKLSGAAQKRRQEASKALRMVDESKVANLDECMTELAQRAAGFKDMTMIKDKDADDLKSEILPKFDRTATEPEKIYATGLREMLPQPILAAEDGLRDDRMTGMLQKPSRIQATDLKELQDVFKTRFGARLAQVRAEANHSEDIDGAELTARRFSALNVLIQLFKCSKPRFKLLDFRKILEVPGDGQKLSTHMFEYYLRPSPVDKRTRSLNKKKIACHIVVLVLDLSLRYKMDFHPLIDELRVDVSEMEENLRYCGCDVSKKQVPDSNGGMQLSLEAELKAPLSWQQAKGAGRGTKRGRG